jgi:urease accessory protein
MLSAPPQPWRAEAQLRFHWSPGRGTVHQGGATAPLKLQRVFACEDGRCELPLLHTAGGLVGGDQLSIRAELAAGSRVLITSVAAQKVYGSVGRSRLIPQGSWSHQRLHFDLQEGADLEWLPQELVVFCGGMIEQSCRVELAPGASWLGADVVRLGRSADEETLGDGCWRSQLEVRRQGRWCMVDRLELGGESLLSPHGLAGAPVFGSLVWAAPASVSESLLQLCRADRAGLEGEMACGRLDEGLVARYRGGSTQAARWWFTRIWARIRAERGLAPPQLPRVWPFQEDPLAGLPSP